MDDYTSDTVVAAVDALQVAEDTLTIAREATVEKEAALNRAKEAETKLVLLQKVAAEHAQAVDGIVEFLEQQGFVAPENLEKLASEMKANPVLGVDLVKRIVNFSASPYHEGEGIPKYATEVATDSAALERALWEKVAMEGA